MCAVQGALSAAERSMRSVFVGNIPYEATEEQLKDIFSEVGPVVSFRLVYDRETGKPKGYGFCEYKDQETALSAMRNLNGHELNGRALRVDNAASEKSKEELKNLQASLGGPPIESPFGPEVDHDKCPEAIAKAVCSLPPEQMCDFLRQMKACLQNNPNEGRNLLLQNPQVAYAMLQALVVMRIIEPQVAVNMLHPQNPNPLPLRIAPSEGDSKSSAPNSMAMNPNHEQQPPAFTTPAVPYNNSQENQGGGDMRSNTGASVPIPGIRSSPTKPSSMPNSGTSPSPRSSNPPRPSLLGDRPQASKIPSDVQRPSGPPNGPYPERGMENFEQYPGPGPHPGGGDRDMRSHQRGGDRDMRQPSGMIPPDQDMRHTMTDQDLRRMHGGPGAMDGRPSFDPRFRNMSQGESAGRSPGNMPPFERSGPNSGPPFERSGPNAGAPFERSGPNTVPPFERPGPNTGPPFERPGPNAGPQFERSGPNTGPSFERSGPNAGPPFERSGPHFERSGPNTGPPFERSGPNSGPPFDQRPPFDGPSPGGPPSSRIEDPRLTTNSAPLAPRIPQVSPRRGPNVASTQSPAMPQSSPGAGASPHSAASLAAAAAAIAPHDQEKAALIMQVLQLADHQIAMLPSEQQHSIMILKEQIARAVPR